MRRAASIALLLAFALALVLGLARGEYAFVERLVRIICLSCVGAA